MAVAKRQLGQFCKSAKPVAATFAATATEPEFAEMRRRARFEDHGLGYRLCQGRVPEAICTARVALLVLPLY